jgi:hypothetical protein
MRCPVGSIVIWQAQRNREPKIDSIIRSSVPEPTEWQRIGNQIDAAMISARADFVSLDAHKQPDVSLKD